MAAHGAIDGGHVAIVANVIARGAVVGTTASLTSNTHVDILRTLANGGVKVFGSSMTSLQLWLLCLMTPQVHTRQTVQLQVARSDVMNAACAAFLVMPKVRRFDVLFLNENGEGDGIRREWLKMAVAVATNPDRGLFSVYGGGNMCYPNALSVSAGTNTLEFQMIGKLCGYALFYREPYVRASHALFIRSHSLRSPYSLTCLFVCFCFLSAKIIFWLVATQTSPLNRRRRASHGSLAVNLPLAFVKVVFGYDVTVEDMKDVNPDEYRHKLAFIRDYTSATELNEYWQETLDLPPLTFAVHARENPLACKRLKQDLVPLKPGGEQILVNGANKAEYLQLYTEYRLRGEIAAQLRAFRTGVSAFFPPGFLPFLQNEASAEDLHALMCGTCTIDVAEWKAASVYMGNMPETQIEWFWEAVTAMSQTVRTRLLVFITGNSKVPATGMANLMAYGGNKTPFALRLIAGGGDRLPTAHTCFNMLDMPAYPNYSTLRDKLALAIHECQGFDEAAVRT